MDCAYFQNLIANEADKALSREEREALEAHVRQCPECRALQEAYAFLSRELSDDLAEAPETLLPAVMEGVWAKNRRHIRKKNRRRWTGVLSAAACVALAVGVGLPLFTPKGSTELSPLYDATPMEAVAAPAAIDSTDDSPMEARIMEAPAAPAAPESAPLPQSEESAPVPAPETAELEMASVPMIAAELPAMDAAGTENGPAPIPGEEPPLTKEQAPPDSAAGILPEEPADAPAATTAPTAAPLAISLRHQGSDITGISDRVGATLPLEAVISPADAAVTLQWRSTDELVATVDASGLVTLTGPGSCDILVTAGSAEARCPVSVSE